MGYIDLYLLPVPTAVVATEYHEQASLFGQVLKEYGALNYREFKADAIGEGTSEFVKLVFTKPDEILTTAIAEFESKTHRDEVMRNVMADPRIKIMEHQTLADMQRLSYGGFEQFVGEQRR